MFAKKSSAQTQAPTTVLGKGTMLEAARMTGSETVQIDGVYRGNVDIAGNLIVADSGTIAGNVMAAYVLVAGRIDGNIKCESVAHFTATATVKGDIEARSLIVDEGGMMEGRYRIGELPPELDGIMYDYQSTSQ